ncbi:MAG: sugar ABC transporter permease, partial [Clostridia bacterium]|nr:sugar ABC transporter permease [Clostridia bacterium]
MQGQGPSEAVTERQPKKFNQRKKNRGIFYACMVALPLLQFCVMYIYVNFNSILLSFQEYIPNVGKLGYKVKFAKLSNYLKAWEEIERRTYMLKNSLLVFFCSTIVGIVLALIFSFYLYKNYLGSGLFKVVLFMPQIISGVVFALLFKYMVTDVYKELYEMVTNKTTLGLFDDNDTRFPTILFFNIWIGFGVNVMLFSGSMSGINESVVESAHLDGVNLIQEFWYITIPMIYPTLVTFIVVGLAGIFTNQAHLYTLFASSADTVSTYGYFMYVQTLKADVTENINNMSYPELSAMGLMMTLVVFPLTVGVRKLLEKCGPSVD